MPRVYILILNYKNWQDTLECLESVSRLKYPDFYTIVIDNDSGNESLQQLMARVQEFHFVSGETGFQYVDSRDLVDGIAPDFHSRLIFVQNERNAGFAAGNNLALRWLTGQNAYIWLLNPDMIVQEDTLTQLAEFASHSPEKSIIGSVIKFHEKPERTHFYGGYSIRFESATVLPVTSPDQVYRLDYISGGSLFTLAASFRNIGLLPEEYFLYWEETDWCYRARQAGYQLAVCPTAISFDKVGTTIGRGFKAEYYYTRNGLLFVSRYKARKLPLVFVFSLFRLLKRTLSGRWDSARGIREGISAYLKRNNL